MNREQRFEEQDNKMECVECGITFDCDTDIWLCDMCKPKFDLDKLWAMHDQNKIDALDFNENEGVRDKFLK